MPGLFRSARHTPFAIVPLVGDKAELRWHHGRAATMCAPMKIAIASDHAAFALKEGDGSALEAGAVEPFPCKGFTLNVGALRGHPREVAKLIARSA